MLMLLLLLMLLLMLLMLIAHRLEREKDFFLFCSSELQKLLSNDFWRRSQDVVKRHVFRWRQTRRDVFGIVKRDVLTCRQMRRFRCHQTWRFLRRYWRLSLDNSLEWFRVYFLNWSYVHFDNLIIYNTFNDVGNVQSSMDRLVIHILQLNFIIFTKFQ